MILLLLFLAGYLGLTGFLMMGLLWASRKGDAVRIAPEPSDPSPDAALYPVPTRPAKPLQRHAQSELRVE
jgi:hypothetical protein